MRWIGRVLGRLWRLLCDGGPPEGCEAGPSRDAGLLTRDLRAGRRWERMRSRWGSWRTRAWQYFAYGLRPDPLPSHQGPIEPPPAAGRGERVGICCSGGGIRSAAFNLGALQALQRKRVLEQADYLAAVSGGSYIASAMAIVQRDLPPGADPAFAPRTPEEQYLRNRSSYMAPDGVGKLYVAYRVLLALALNVVIVMLPVIALAFALTPWLYDPRHNAQGAVTSIAIPGLWRVAVGLAIASALVGIAGLVWRGRGIRPQRFSETWSTRLLIGSAGAGWLFAGLPWLTGELPDLANSISDFLTSSDAPADSATTSGSTADAAAPAAGAATAAVATAGLLAGILAALRSAVAKPVESGGKVVEWFKKLGNGARMAIVYGAATLAAPLLVAGTMVLVVSRAVDLSDEVAWTWALGCALAFAGVYFLADSTTWSLHPFYKSRLCGAFALERVTENVGGRDVAYARPRDYDRLIKLSETALPAESWPTLLVCAAANVSDPGATPPGRPVTSFTFSPHAIGGPLVGGISTTAYEDAFDGARRRGRDITLPAAVAMSGAAIAPSMGKMTRRPFTFLPALANARLGVWLPNPGWVARAEPGKRTPFGKARLGYLFRELLGRNRLDARYLFVTDEAPWDVKAYHREDADFPRHTTADQLYTDQRFESYRVLGQRAGARALGLMGVAADA